MRLSDLIESIQFEMDLYAQRGSNAKPAPRWLTYEDYQELKDEMMSDPGTLYQESTDGFKDVRVLGVQIRCLPPDHEADQDELAEEYERVRD